VKNISPQLVGRLQKIPPQLRQILFFFADNYEEHSIFSTPN
jgi:hypothetical protein